MVSTGTECGFSFRCNFTLMMFSRERGVGAGLHVWLSLGCLPFASCQSVPFSRLQHFHQPGFIVLLMRACIYRIHCRNYEVLNQNKQVEWMKSSDIAALIVPIRVLLIFPLLNYGQWSSRDRQIITFQPARQVRWGFFYLTEDKADKESKMGGK